ncbi:MAG: YigZ family protein [Bacillota bacterium]
MKMSDCRYFTLTGTVRVQFSVEGSRFIATMTPAASEETARAVLETIRREFPDATHHTFAYRIGIGPDLIERAGDDREPAGTAGLPMLQVLTGAALSGVIVVGTRYFGGIKLGIGGLARAYRGCAKACLEQATLVERETPAYYRITLAYEDLGAMTRHIQTLGGEIISVDYAAAVTLAAAVPASAVAALVDGVMEISRGRGCYEECEQRSGVMNSGYLNKSISSKQL